MAHKGKATSDVTYNPDDGPEAYTNPAIHSRLSEYTAMAKDRGRQRQPERSHCGLAPSARSETLVNPAVFTMPSASMSWA